MASSNRRRSNPSATDSNTGPGFDTPPITEDRIVFINNQRSTGFAEISTGSLRFRVNKQSDGGFLDAVQLDAAGDGGGAEDTIATGPAHGPSPQVT